MQYMICGPAKTIKKIMQRLIESSVYIYNST